MNADQKERALQILSRFQQADPLTWQADNAAMDMADLLQELIDKQPAGVPAGYKGVPVEPTDETIEAVALNRYQVKRNDNTLLGWCVVAGDGDLKLYCARKANCENVARKLIGAFLDGAFYATTFTQPDPELAKDAERYRAIRQGMVYVEPHPDGKIYVATDRGVYCKTSSEVDDIIDAAIAAEKGGEA